jgi:hypothetical protein
MATSADNSCNGDRNRGTIRDYERFIDWHRSVLLRYLDGTAPASAEDADALGYVESVLAEWHGLFDETELPSPGPEERTFWFALYQLEELAELPAPHVEPYERLLRDELVEARELLRQRRPPPSEHGFMATRPDGT